MVVIKKSGVKVEEKNYCTEETCEVSCELLKQINYLLSEFEYISLYEIDSRISEAKKLNTELEYILEDCDC